MLFDEGFKIIQKDAVDVIISFLNGYISNQNQNKGDKKIKIFENSEYVRLYTLSYNLCSCPNKNENNSEKFYLKHTEILTKFTKDLFDKFRYSGDVLKNFINIAEIFKIMNTWLSKLFTYIDRYYVSSSNVLHLSESGISIFGNIYMDDIYSYKIANKLSEDISNIRNGQIIDRDTIKKCISIYKYMDILGKNKIYVSNFEKCFLENSEIYFIRKMSDISCLSLSTRDYLQTVQKFMEEDVKITQDIFTDLETIKKNEVLIIDIFINRQCKEVMENKKTGLVSLIVNNELDILELVYRTFSKVPNNVCLEIISKIFSEHVEKSFYIDNEDIEEADLISEILKLYESYMKIVKNQFHNDPIFLKRLNMAFETILNTGKKTLKIVELLAQYLDSFMKTSTQEYLVEEILVNLSTIFTFIVDKDIFATIYGNLLAKRLLSQRSVSIISEKSMITKLKLRCGNSYTSKLEGSISDLELSTDRSDKFLKYLSGGIQCPCEFECVSLSTAYWPTFKNVIPILPEIFKKNISIYEEFYSKDTQHRKLNWMFTKGSVTLKAFYNKNTYEIVLSTLQGIVLLGMSTNGESFDEINIRLGSDQEISKRILHSLSCQPKFKLLIKTPDTQKISSTDTFSLNKNFSSKITKFKVPVPEIDVETHTNEKIVHDRSMAIEASIVRIAKSRKRISHINLVSEVLSQLSNFKPDPKMIKKQIELLIEKEYLERDEEIGHYNYLA